MAKRCIQKLPVFFSSVFVFFFVLLNSDGPLKVAKAKLLRKSLSISHRWMRVGAEPQVTTETPLTWMLPFTFISIRDKKKNIGHKTQKILFTAFWNMTLIFTIFAMETFCERFLLQYVHKGAIGLLLIIVEAMPILPQFLIQSTKVFHLKIRPTLTPRKLCEAKKKTKKGDTALSLSIESYQYGTLEFW